VHNDNGATYIFFDASGNVLPTHTVEGLATATNYIVIGTPTADKFYVYNDNAAILTENMGWGKADTLVGTQDGIGKGRINTNAAMALSGWESTSIWTALATVNTNAIGGRNDWYIGSSAELD